MCTHLILIGDTYLYKNGSISLPNPETLRGFVALKHQNPQLNLLICLTPANRLMSMVAGDDYLSAQFINDIANYLVQNNLNGFGNFFEILNIFNSLNSVCNSFKKKPSVKFKFFLKNFVEEKKRLKKNLFKSFHYKIKN